MVYVHYDPRDFFPRRSITITTDEPELDAKKPSNPTQIPSRAVRTSWLESRCNFVNAIRVTDGSNNPLLEVTNLERYRAIARRCPDKVQIGEHRYQLHLRVDDTGFVTARYQQVE